MVMPGKTEEKSGVDIVPDLSPIKKRKGSINRTLSDAICGTGGVIGRQADEIWQFLL
jgi:16S rRNA C967 or C1407 C5-methylase (RsmB/RsmF family)